MCYKHGSIEEATAVCPMCRVFKHARCPHVKDVCRDRANHPAHDVVYLKNPEVSTFNGCGYCKWARSTKAPGAPNAGWPGCCRAPSTGEALRIPPADWVAVTAVHKVAPPPEIRMLLDSLSPPALPPVTRSPKLASAALSPQKKVPAAAGVTPKVSRTSGSPKIPSAAPPMRGGAPTSPVLGAPEQMRRASSGRARDASPAARTRRSLDQEGTLGRRAAPAKKAPSASALAIALAHAALEDARPAMRRRGSNATEASHGSGGSGGSGGSPPRTDGKSSRAAPRKAPSPEPVRAPKAAAPRAKAAAVPSDGSSTGSSAPSESTVTSEGFTDYLSDESDAEMQRQAEERAARLPATWAEDEEFARARKQLTGVGLRPPVQWGERAATVGGRTGASRAYPTAAALQQRLKA